ncbi:MAG: hypothetical protein AB7T49_15860 [Oligoflexales bacterium]
MATISAGDIVFGPDGRPGVVVGRKPETNELLVEKGGPEYEKARRRGFINGVPQNHRPKFNEIVDQVLELKTPREKIQMLTDRIGELKQDPRNHLLTKYLEGELSHVMNAAGESMQTYAVEESEVK